MLFKQKNDLELSFFEKQSIEVEEEIKKINKDCMGNYSLLIKKLDEVIYQSMIAIIANFNTKRILRDDFIVNVDRLLIIREKIANNHCNN